MGGLEPPLREELDPKSSAATNYATSASKNEMQKYTKNPIARHLYGKENILHILSQYYKSRKIEKKG